MDKTIKIWDFQTGKLLNTLKGHTRTIESISVKNDIIVSGSIDKTIKVWDLNTGDCINTLLGHENSVECVLLLDDKIVSGAWDKTIKIWNLSTGICEKTFYNLPGLFIHGCNFKNLHPDSNITQKDLEILSLYNANI